MANDHFETHAYHKGKIDWNFNLIFTDVPEVGDLAERYASVLDRPELYPPVPRQWLHQTILRVGFAGEESEGGTFTAADMDNVCEKLAPRLAGLALPKITVGPSWEYKGYPLLHMSPEEPLNEIFQAVRQSLGEAVGADRLPNPVDRPADQLIVHIALAYPHTHDKEAELAAALAKADETIEPIEVQLRDLSLVRQWPTGEHYEWEVVRNLRLGRA